MKFNARQYSLASFSVLIALSGTAHSATTYMEARNDAMGEPVWRHLITERQRWQTLRC